MDTSGRGPFPSTSLSQKQNRDVTLRYLPNHRFHRLHVRASGLGFACRLVNLRGIFIHAGVEIYFHAIAFFRGAQNHRT